MSPEEAQRFLAEVREVAPGVAALALDAASGAFRLRREFLRRQPRKRQAEWMRKALGRTVGAPLAEQVLATYFLEHHLELLTDLLDRLGLEHEEGQLTKENPACPPRAALEAAVSQFLEGEEPGRRQLLLRAFAAQSAIDWPELEALLEALLEAGSS